MIWFIFSGRENYDSLASVLSAPSVFGFFEDETEHRHLFG
jgi:hypothetical protein